MKTVVKPVIKNTKAIAFINATQHGQALTDVSEKKNI